MQVGHQHRLAKAIHTIAGLPSDSDADLLARFVAERNEAAFQAIIQRHGGLVFDVCRSVLRNDADAEDAFQATFMTLALRVESIRSRESLSAWLHGVAYRIALKARQTASRRRVREENVPPKAEQLPPDPSWAEVREAIHREVDALPDKVRSAIVLCYLLGRTQEQAARSLGLSTEGVKKRLERGRGLLRDRLTRRGFGPVAILATSSVPLLPLPSATAASTGRLAVEMLQSTSEAGIVPASIHKLIERGTSMSTVAKCVLTSTAFTLLVGLAVAIDWRDPIATASAAPGLPPERKDLPVAAKSELDGTWKVINISDKDVDVPDQEYEGLKFTFSKGQLKLSIYPDAKDKNWNPDYLQGATFRLDPESKPKSIDLTLDPKVAKKATITGIYQIRDGRLLIGVRTMKSVKLPRPKGYSTPSGTLISFTLELDAQAGGVKN